MKGLTGLRRGAAIAFVCFAALFSAARAQTTTVSASYVGGAVSPVSSATMYFQPVNGCAYGASIGAARQGSNQGQIKGLPYTATVTGGVTSLSVPDSLLTNPNIAYAATAIDNTTGDIVFGLGLQADGRHVQPGGPYGCLQPTGSTWNFDAYVPSTPITILPSALFDTPSTTTGAPGTSAAVTLTPTSGQYHFAFSIPTGAAGPNCATGSPAGHCDLGATELDAASAVAGGTVKISAGKPWYDISLGAACNGTTDDYTKLQANLTAAAGAVAYLPPNTTCETSRSLTLPINTDLNLAKNGMIQALSGSTGWAGTCVVQTPRSSTTVLAHIYGGGAIDANNIADCALWLPETWQSYVQDSHFLNGTVYGVHIGSASVGGSQSYQTYVMNNEIEVGYQGTGTVTPGSAGVFLDAADQFVVGNAINCYDVGIRVASNSAHNMIERNHPWCYNHYTADFEDGGQLNSWIGNYADSPATYGFHMTSTANYFTIIGGTVYANALTTDNTMVGIQVDYAFTAGNIEGVMFNGRDGTHRLAADVNWTANYATGHFLSMRGNAASNTVTVNSYDSPPNLAATTSSGKGAIFIGGFPALQLYGTHNTFVGYAGNLSLSGADNTGVGYHAGAALTTGSGNVAVGKDAFAVSTSGTNNAAFGVFALNALTTGTNNTAAGYAAGSAITAGTGNTFVGHYAGEVATGISYDTGIGDTALLHDTGGSNTGIGASALLLNTSGTNNVAVGANALLNNLTGSSNVAIGKSALLSATGSFDTAVGASALANDTGGTNTAVGSSALTANTTAVQGVAVGANACNGITTGSHNTCIGYSAGAGLTTAQFSTFVGFNANASSDGLTDDIAIGQGAQATASHQAVIGTSTTTQTIMYGIRLGTLYSAAGTALPTCVTGLKGGTAVVSDATSPTYLGAYTSGGAVVAPVMCNGSVWVTY